jgi:hypothetical protein
VWQLEILVFISYTNMFSIIFTNRNFTNRNSTVFCGYVHGGVVLMAETITEKTVCMVGLGYVSLPLAEAFAAHMRMIGFRRDSAPAAG